MGNILSRVFLYFNDISSSINLELFPQLVAGSGATEASDEKEHAPAGAGGVAEIDVAGKADGYTEGIPGPITRLFVLANRGLANLVQDLILVSIWSLLPFLSPTHARFRAKQIVKIRPVGSQAVLWLNCLSDIF